MQIFTIGVISHNFIDLIKYRFRSMQNFWFLFSRVFVADNYIEPASKEWPLDVSTGNLKFQCHSVFLVQFGTSFILSKIKIIP